MNEKQVLSTATTAPADPVRVWDLPTRVFHWSLVAAVAAAMLIGYLAPEWWLGEHVLAGWAVGALLVFRLVWGVYGSHHSRFASLPVHPRRLAEHLSGLARLRPPRVLGHNPAGAAMIVLLLLVLAGLTLSGLAALGGAENQGPLAGWLGFATGSVAAEVHGLLAFMLLGLVGGHVVGVLLESLLLRENLPAAMVTGIKRGDPATPAAALRPPRPLAALCALAAVGLAGAGVLGALAAAPPSGLRELPPHDLFQEECGGCHWPHHPSLLPADSWRALTASLADHFGEDASLDPESSARITAYLAANAAETWDTEAARRLRAAAPAAPWQVTAAPYWAERHRGIPGAVFARARVGGKSNCRSCHRDADSGRFDDQSIHIPKE